MKKTPVFLLLLLCLSIIQGCKKIDDGSYAAPITITERLAGAWKMDDLIQTDEIAKANAETNTMMDLKDQFGFSSFTLILTVDANQKPTTFTVGGTAPLIIPTSGSWDVDNSFVHTDATSSIIYLYSDASKATKTATLEVLAMPGLDKKGFTFKLTRKVSGLPFVSYTYKLKNQTK